MHLLIGEVVSRRRPRSVFFFFNDTATTEIYTLSLHDALPISFYHARQGSQQKDEQNQRDAEMTDTRSEEHTSELQSPCNLVCRLLLEKKKNINTTQTVNIIYAT